MRDIGLFIVFTQLVKGTSLHVAAAFGGAVAQQQPWCHAEIDYSAANEFIAAHYYGCSTTLRDNKYFDQDRAVEPIYNARELDEQHAFLPDCGFTLLQQQPAAAAATPPRVNWSDLDSIRESYLPTVREALLSVYGAENVSDIVFWCPTLRTQDSLQTARDRDGDSNNEVPRASYVSTAHIDTDVNAFESTEQLVRMIAKNVFPGTACPSAEIIKYVDEDRRRFAIVNAWRNIRSAPIQRAPLAFLSTRYAVPNTAFPNAKPSMMGTSKWYTYPDMTPNELLLFCQYDRDAAHPSDLFHCALILVGTGGGGGGVDAPPPRESFDVRCLVIFKDVVPVDRDRLARRVPSILNHKQSQTFCAEQAEKRQQAT